MPFCSIASFMKEINVCRIDYLIQEVKYLIYAKTPYLAKKGLINP